MNEAGRKIVEARIQELKMDLSLKLYKREQVVAQLKDLDVRIKQVHDEIQEAEEALDGDS